MKVAYVTAGAAGMFCGSCMRDNTLVRTLRRQGVNVTLVPTFTPIRTDEEDASLDRVFLGGINIYLEQRSELWRRLPTAAKRWFDRPAVLRAIAPLALATRREYDTSLAISLLRGEQGNQRDEIEQIVTWLAEELQPDVVHLSNLVIAGFVAPLRQRLDASILVTLQGDDLFFGTLAETERASLLRELRIAARAVDGFVVMSDYYRDHMAALLEVPRERFHRVRLGIADPEAFASPRWSGMPDSRAASRPPTVGYLARLCPEKGFHLLVDAFVKLRSMPGTTDARLRFGGWLGGADRPYFEAQIRKLEAAVGAEAFEHVPLPDRDAKFRLLRDLDVFSVPTTHREPKGLFVLEALAAGVPVVLPAHGCFPELVRDTGGARLVSPGDVEALAEAIHALLRDPSERRRLGAEGQRRVCAEHHAVAAADDTLDLWKRMFAAQSAAHTASRRTARLPPRGALEATR